MTTSTTPRTDSDPAAEYNMPAFFLLGFCLLVLASIDPSAFWFFFALILCGICFLKKQNEVAERQQATTRLATVLAGGGGGGGGESRGVSAEDATNILLHLIESQRQMVNVNDQNVNDGSCPGPSGGVSQKKRQVWKRLCYEEEMVKLSSSSSPASPEVDSNDKGEAEKGNCNPRKTTVEESSSCSICLNEYKKDDKIVNLQCNHIYHEECISDWCDENVRCPLCNYDLEEGKEFQKN